MEDEPHAGRPSTSKTVDNVERVMSLVRSDHRLTLRMISSELNLNGFTVYGFTENILKYKGDTTVFTANHDQQITVRT